MARWCIREARVAAGFLVGDLLVEQGLCGALVGRPMIGMRPLGSGKCIPVTKSE